MIELKPFQQEAVDFVVSRSGAAVFAEQGTGKTYITGGVIRALWSDDFAGLVVVPLANVETTWVRTLERFEIPHHRTWKSFRDAGYRGLLLLHYEMVRGNLVKRLVKRHWTLVVYDESQRLKKRSSKASRAAGRFKNVDHRLALSGTPVEQAPQDLWAQLRFAAPDVLGTRWTDFDERYLRPTGFMGYKRKFRQELFDKFLSRIKPAIYRVRKDEVLDLPPLTFKLWPVTMLGRQDKLYRAIERDGVATVDGHEIICDLEVTRVVRLQQIAGGFVRNDDGDSIRVGSAKLRRLRAIARLEDWPIVVFTKYAEELEDAVAGLQSMGMRVGVVSGNTRKQRTATVEKFQAGHYDALVCQIRAGGVGLDLFQACVGVVYSTTFSSIDFDQAIARLHRNGQTRPVRFWLMPVSNTIDTTIQLVIATKRKVAEAVLDDHRTRRR